MRNTMKTVAIYGSCVLGFQTVFRVPALTWILFPFVLGSPIIIAVTALVLTRSIPVEKRPLRLVVLSILLYFSGLIADVLAHWLAMRGSPLAAGYDIWYPIYPSSSGINLCGLYGTPHYFHGRLLDSVIQTNTCRRQSPNLAGSSEMNEENLRLKRLLDQAELEKAA